MVEMKEFLPRFLAVNGPSILIGVVAIYLLGRWDASESIRLANWLEETDEHVEDGLEWLRYRVERDSLLNEQEKAEARVAALGRLVAAQTSEIADYEAAVAHDSAASADAEIADLLPHLKLTLIAENTFATDSIGVRFLDSLRIKALNAPLVRLLRQQNETLVDQRTELQRALLLAGKRADSADARVIVLEDLLEEGRRLSTCKIAGFLPCPSRGMMFIGGALAGVTVALALVLACQ
jgi:hypothetical protein